MQKAKKSSNLICKKLEVNLPEKLKAGLIESCHAWQQFGANDIRDNSFNSLTMLEAIYFGVC